MSDYRALDLLGASTSTSGSACATWPSIRARARLDRAWDGARAEAPGVPAGEPAQPEPGQAVLATWRLLLDDGRLQDGEPFLAGTATRAGRPALGGHRGRGRRCRRSRCGGVHRRGADHRAGRRRPRCPTGWSGCRPTPRPAPCTRASRVDAGAVVQHQPGGGGRMSLARLPLPASVYRRPTTRRSLRPGQRLDRPGQGDRHLRLPGRHHAVGDLVRAPRDRPDAAAAGPEPDRPVRPAPDAGRRRQAGAEGRHHPEGRRQGRLHPRARSSPPPCASSRSR